MTDPGHVGLDLLVGVERNPLHRAERPARLTHVGLVLLVEGPCVPRWYDDCVLGGGGTLGVDIHGPREGLKPRLRVWMDKSGKIVVLGTNDARPEAEIESGDDLV